MRAVWRHVRVCDANKSVGDHRIFCQRRRARGARKRQLCATAERFSLGIFKFSEANQQQKKTKKMHFPYETVVFSSSIPLASEE
jgi:hypothetical protein